MKYFNTYDLRIIFMSMIVMLCGWAIVVFANLYDMLDGGMTDRFVEYHGSKNIKAISYHDFDAQELYFDRGQIYLIDGDISDLNDHPLYIDYNHGERVVGRIFFKGCSNAFLGKEYCVTLNVASFQKNDQGGEIIGHHKCMLVGLQAISGYDLCYQNVGMKHASYFPYQDGVVTMLIPRWWLPNITFKKFRIIINSVTNQVTDSTMIVKKL